MMFITILLIDDQSVSKLVASDTLKGALKRSHGAQLPKSSAAQRRLCELQLGRALSSGDEAELTMALREASRVGGDEATDFEGFALVKQKLANQRALCFQVGENTL